jgi:hypothetical protein
MLDFLIATDAIRRKTSASFDTKPAKEPPRKGFARRRSTGGRDGTVRSRARTVLPWHAVTERNV